MITGNTDEIFENIRYPPFFRACNKINVTRLIRNKPLDNTAMGAPYK
jgi:hypothetical protein